MVSSVGVQFHREIQTIVKTGSIQLSWWIHHKPLLLFQVPYRSRKRIWFANLCSSPNTVQPVNKDGPKDSTQLGTMSSTLLVEPHLEHQTTEKAQQLREPKWNSYLCTKTNKRTCIKYVTLQVYKECNKLPNYISGTTQRCNKCLIFSTRLQNVKLRSVKSR